MSDNIQKSGENNPKPDKLKIEYSLELWPILVVGIVLLGILHLNYYYQYHYNFNIIPYLDFSEILISSFVNIGVLDVGLIIIPLSGITQIIFYYFNNIRLLKNLNPFRFMYIIYKHIVHKKRIQSKYFIKMITDTVLLIVAIFITLAIPNVVFFLQNKLGKRYLWDYETVQIYQYYSLFILIPNILLHHLKYIKFKTFIYVIFTVILLNSIILVSERKYISISKEHFSFGTKIFTKKGTIISDSNYYYIDKSRNFVFMYDEKNSSMTAIPMSEVEKLIIVNDIPKKKAKLKPKTQEKPALITLPNNASDTTKKLQK